MLITWLLMCSGCTQIIYNHERFLNELKNKEQVTQALGKPDEQAVEDEWEEWLYYYSTAQADSLQSRSLKGFYHQSGHTDTVKTLSNYEHCIVYTFNKKGKVVQWDAKGIKLVQKKFSPVKTGVSLAMIGLSVVLVIGFGKFFAALFNSVPGMGP